MTVLNHQPLAVTCEKRIDMSHGALKEKHHVAKGVVSFVIDFDIIIIYSAYKETALLSKMTKKKDIESDTWQEKNQSFPSAHWMTTLHQSRGYRWYIYMSRSLLLHANNISDFSTSINITVWRINWRIVCSVYSFRGLKSSHEVYVQCDSALGIACYGGVHTMMMTPQTATYLTAHDEIYWFIADITELKWIVFKILGVYRSCMYVDLSITIFTV